MRNIIWGSAFQYDNNAHKRPWGYRIVHEKAIEILIEIFIEIYEIEGEKTNKYNL